MLPAAIAVPQLGPGLPPGWCIFYALRTFAGSIFV